MRHQLLRLSVCLFLSVLLASCGGKSHHPDLDSPLYTGTPGLKLATERIAKDTGNAKLYFQRGQLLQKMQADSPAMKDYLHAIALDSTKGEYYGAVGDLLFEAHDISGSVDWLRKALRLNPQDPKARLKMAKMLLFTKDVKGVFTEVNTVLRADAYNAEAYFLKGMAYKDMKDTANAEGSFQTALQVQPDYSPAHLQLGLLAQGKRDSTALQYFANAFRTDTTDLLPIYMRGQYMQARQQWERAKEEYRFALSQSPQYADAAFAYGFVLLQQDSVEKALPFFDRAAKADPQNADAFFNRGLCQEIVGQKAQAATSYREALKVRPGHDAAKTALARVQ